MPRTATPETDEAELARALRRRGQRATPQRMILLRALRDLGRHVTAEEVFRLASGRLPGLSLPTVYATLELFEGLGLVRRVRASGTALFEPRLDGHPHFACRVCGSVADLESEPHAGRVTRAARAVGHVPESADVVIHGVCAACAAGR